MKHLLSSPQNDTATTTLNSEDGVFVMIDSIWLPLNGVFGLTAKKWLNFGLMKP